VLILWDVVYVGEPEGIYADSLHSSRFTIREKAEHRGGISLNLSLYK